MRMLTLLCEAGDVTLSWTEDKDSEMEEIIRRKMAEGVTFFIVERGRGQITAIAHTPDSAPAPGPKEVLNELVTRIGNGRGGIFDDMKSDTEGIV